jgi:acetolactate synthase-1/2/3 large subunit
MQLMTGGDLLARTFVQEGVEYMFGIIGGQILPLFDALVREPGLKYIMPRNEAAGALMADGYARASGKVAVVISTVGAGAIYSAAGTADAWGDHVPIFSVSPQVQTWKMYPAQESLQGCYQADMLAGVTRWNCIAYNWKRLPRLAQRALREALSGEQGPVHMDVPVDVFFEAHFVTDRKLKKLLPPAGTSRFSGSFLPDTASVSEAADLLGKAEKPVVAAGLSVLREGAWASLATLAENIPAPVALTPAGLSSLEGDNPAYIGIMGHAALTNIAEALDEADLVMMVGTTLGEQEEILGMVDRSRVKVLQTSPEPELLGALGPVEAALAGDAASVARALEGSIKAESPQRVKWAESCRSSFESTLESVRKDAKGKGPGAAVNTLGEAVGPEDLVVLDGRESYYWGSLLCPAGMNNSRFVSHGLKGIGYGLPMAMGMKLARPRDRVFALCDTEALLHHIQELETAKREGIAVIVGVVGEPYGWKQVAEGFGLSGVKAGGPAELMAAVEKAGKSDAATLIDLTEFEA